MIKTSTCVLVLIFSFLFIFNAQAQNEAINTGIGFGFQIHQFQKDFGLGLNITSPFFGDDRIAVRLRGNLMYNENVQNATTTWTPYSNVSLGLIGIGGKVGEYIRLYGEGGLIGIKPSSDFSTKNFVFGGYGLFGFEFFMNNSSNYFIEIGGVGTDAKADKIVTKPIYSNGLLISAGFRIHLK
jgi:hypothetical protein